ncbi:MAG: hypothetical protein QGG36_31935 [Pirellulaceae bacterium]|nr:hypothetical protein [Pirellulaceae bacterium]
MAIDPYKHQREKKWRYVYTRSDKLHRAKQLGIEYPRQPASQLLDEESINVLFVCSMNRWRSPTAERVYADHERINTRSRGTSQKARRTISADDIKWADVIFAMDDKHRQQLQSRFPGEMAYAEIHVLDIPDDYQFMDPELIQCIKDAVGELLAD